MIMLLQCGVTCFTIICTGHAHLQYFDQTHSSIMGGPGDKLWSINYACLFPPPTPPTHLLIHIHLQIDNIPDIYAQTLPESPPTRALFNVLRVKVDREVQFQRHAFELLGTLDTLLTASTATQRHQVALSQQPLGERGSDAILQESTSGGVLKEMAQEEMGQNTDVT